MANNDRLTAEFLVCGLTGFSGNFTDGHPVFDPPLNQQGSEMAAIIYAAHVEDDQLYTSTAHDLRTRPECVAVFNAVTPVQWDAYKDIQKKYVKYERRKRMREGCCLDKVTPGDLKDKWLRTNAPEDRTAWLAALQAIESAVPYPSGQSD